MVRLLVVLLVAASFGCSPPRVGAHPAALSAASITDYGATGTGDDRAAIQAALTANAGGTVYVPAGHWTAGRAGSAYFALTIPAGTTLQGDGAASVLVLAAGTAPSVRLLELDAPGAVIQDLTLDGNRAAQDTDQHRADIFARARFAARRVRATGSSGDGIYLYPGAEGSTLDSVTCDGNGRNGVTMNAGGATVTGSTFRGNAAQQFDSEPGSPAHVDSVRISGSTFDATDGAGQLVSNDYALTICGSAGGQSSGWVLEGNTVVGGIYAVWAQDLVIHRTTGINPTTKPSVRVYRAASSIAIVDNDFTEPAAASVIEVTGTGTGQAADGILIQGNRITGGGATGIALSGAVSALVSGNVITGRAGVGVAAIAARATNPAAAFARVELRRNTATGYDRGLSAGGVAGGPAQIGLLVAGGNRLGAPLWLDDGSGALQRAELTGNDPATVQRWPAGAVLSSDGPTVIMTRSPQ